MAPRVLKTVAEAAQFSEETRRAPKRLALVPTMGFLHAGHLSLMKEARTRADVVAVTIYVNPTQFGPQEDFARYPRDLEGDLAKCGSVGVDVVFAPAANALFRAGYQTYVEVTELSKGLCGERRPGHFRGVATVVAQLFALLRPHVALFGEKDYQQLKVIEKLAADLYLGVEVLGFPTVREPEGLAMSSRNTYLTPGERERALALFRGMNAAKAKLANGTRATAELVEQVRQELARAEIREDYVELVDPDTLTSLSSVESGQSARLLVAGFVGSTRLIDNMALWG